MEKCTLKEIKSYIACNMAKNITDYTSAQAQELRKNCNLETIKISNGKYGLNGALLQDKKNGNLYAIVARNSNLFYFV